MSEAFQKDQNKYLFVTGKSSHSGSEPEDSVIIKAQFYTLRESCGYLGKVRKLQQPAEQYILLCKKLQGGPPPPPAGIGLNIYFPRTMQNQKLKK